MNPQNRKTDFEKLESLSDKTVSDLEQVTEREKRARDGRITKIELPENLAANRRAIQLLGSTLYRLLTPVPPNLRIYVAEKAGGQVAILVSARLPGKKPYVDSFFSTLMHRCREVLELKTTGVTPSTADRGIAYDMVMAEYSDHLGRHVDIAWKTKPAENLGEKQNG